MSDQSSEEEIKRVQKKFCVGLDDILITKKSDTNEERGEENGDNLTERTSDRGAA